MAMQMNSATTLLDKSSYIPYYVQIKQILLDRIRDGIYSVNTRFPSESQLASEFSVTRMTVRKALDELKREGMIQTERGKGSVVSESKIEQSLKHFYRFGREVGNTGIPAQSRVISAETVVPPAEVRKKFGDIRDKEFYKIVRLRFYKDSPVSLEFAYIPCSTAPGIIDQPINQTSLADILEHTYGRHIEKATEYLFPRISDAYESRMLEIQNHSPVFQTERITRAKDHSIIEYRRSVIRGDKVKFSMELY